MFGQLLGIAWVSWILHYDMAGTSFTIQHQSRKWKVASLNWKSKEFAIVSTLRGFSFRLSASEQLDRNERWMKLIGIFIETDCIRLKIGFCYCMSIPFHITHRRSSHMAAHAAIYIPFHKSLSKTQQDLFVHPFIPSFGQLATFFRAACSVLSADSICLQVCLISGHRFLLAIFLVTIDNKQQFESEEFSGLGPERQANLLKRSQMISVWLWIEDVSNLWLHCWQLRSESWWCFMT